MVGEQLFGEVGTSPVFNGEARVGHRRAAQLVLFRHWTEGADDRAIVGWWDANPGDPSLVRVLDRQALWGRVAALVTRERVPWREAARVGLQLLADTYVANERTQQKVVKEITRFVRYVTSSGVEWLDDLEASHVETFVWWAAKRNGQYIDVKATTAANRQSFIRRFMTHLTDAGLWRGGDIVGPPIARDLGETSRLLSEAEVHRVRVHADTGLFRSRRALLVVLAEAGADATETALARLCDLDLAAGTVCLGERERWRVNEISEWGRGALSEVLAHQEIDPTEPLCVTPGLPVDRAAHSVTVRLRAVLADAQLLHLPRVTARSIRLTAADRVLATRGIVAAAKFLGNVSLDVTAASLGYDWGVR